MNYPQWLSWEVLVWMHPETMLISEINQTHKLNIALSPQCKKLKETVYVDVYVVKIVILQFL